MVVLLFARRGIKELSDALSNLRTGKIILLLAGYSFGGALMFHYLEMYMTTREELTFGTGCLARYNSYWASLNYVNTLYTTMGYGSLYCCSWLGRLLSCVYIFIGTPILLVVLESLGKVLAKFCTTLWTFGGRFLRNVAAFAKRIAAIITRRKRPSSEIAIVEEGKKQAEAKKGDDDDEEQMIPLSAGLGVSMVWLLGAGVYFHYLEGWSYGSSIYFLWISITTVGLGDFAPTKYEYTIITYTLLLVGLSLMSMCIAILQAKIENMVKRLQADMLRRRNSLPPGTEPTPEEQKKSNGLLGKIMKNPEEKLLKMMLTTNQRDLVEGNDKKSQSLHNVRTQTRTPATVTTVKLCDQHRHYAEISASRDQIVINEGDEITLTNSSGKKSFKNQFAQIATEELYVLADDSLRETPVGGDCIICRALEDAKPPTPLPPPPTPPKSESPVIEKPKWRM